jgi:hypothetical protein
MGSTSFLLPKTLPAGAARLLERACFAGGYDQTPVPTLSEVDGGRLYVSRDLSESGYLLVPWLVEPFGTFVVTTATLRERDEPYPLMIELARGKLNQVRTQTADWQVLGLRTPPAYDRELDDATRLFGKAVLNPSPAEADSAAARVLGHCFALADRLVRLYTEQMFSLRVRDEKPLPARLAARFSVAPAGDPAADYRNSFNAARVGVRWCDLEPAESEYEWGGPDDAIDFASGSNLPVTFGPLIDLAPGKLPAWAAGWQGDLPTLAAFMCDYVETVIGRYKSSVRRWVICGGFNHADGLGLSDDDRLRLSARLFEAARQLDPDLELVLGIAQPWGDYMTHDEQTIPPFSFADDLLRAGVRLAGVELEVRPGTAPRGSLPRDLLDTSRLLDTFSLLGTPLDVLLAYPASGAPDPVAASHGESLDGDVWAAPPTPEGQAEWGGSFAELALCKPQVRTVTWDHLSDADPHITPHSGLVGRDGSPRPLIQRLRSIRNARLRLPADGPGGPP